MPVTIRETVDSHDREGVVVNYASIIEQGAIDQSLMIARGHVTDGPVVMLPDAHIGAGACVGTAIMTKGGIYPAAVGVDIGCGMIAIKTDIKGSDLSLDDRRTIHRLISQTIPSGMGTKRERAHYQWESFVNTYGYPPVAMREGIDSNFASMMMEKAAIQFGTLGGGNHFVEVSVDENDDVWTIVHSGSRGVGNKMAQLAITAAKSQCALLDRVLEAPDIAFLTEGTDAYHDYIEDMIWSQHYAFWQRECMMDEVMSAIDSVTGKATSILRKINCHHNYSEFLKDGRILTRKGAIDANEGVWGVIPGSMGTDSFIVRGLGDPKSYWTSQHGAGRMGPRGRPEKKRADGTIKPASGAWANDTVENLESQMEGKVWNNRSAFNLLDEAPNSYKDIAVVMEDSIDLTEAMFKLNAIINYKGT